jgi:hypothetical protein
MMFVLFLFIVLAEGVIGSQVVEYRELCAQRKELFHRINDHVTEDNANSVKYFEELFDERVRVFVHRGDKSDIEYFRGIQDFLDSCSKWYVEGFNSHSTITSYYDALNQLDHISFITGDFEFTSPVTHQKTWYTWLAKAQWNHMKIIQYDLYSDFTHLEQQLEQQLEKQLKQLQE